MRASFAVSGRPGRPRTTGEAEQQHLSRKSWALRVREHGIRLGAVPAVAAIAICWWSAPAASLELSARMVVLAGPMGVLAAAALAALLDSRTHAFFRTVKGLSQHVHGAAGPTDAQFLHALRALRPDLFAGARHAGHPRLFAVVVERNGVLFLGSGVRPRVAAAFHWLHVRQVTAPENPPGTPHQRTHRVDFVVSRDGAKVELGFPFERAKVAWTQRSYLENKPLEAVLSLLQGLRHTWGLSPLGARNGATTWPAPAGNKRPSTGSSTPAHRCSFPVPARHAGNSLSWEWSSWSWRSGACSSR